jgi:tetratricopeptide (TPR) repeat protein
MSARLLFPVRCFLVVAALLSLPAWQWSALAADSASPEPSAEDLLATNRHTGWKVARAVVHKLEQQSGPKFPGIQAWLESFHELTKKIDPKTPPEKWPTLDVDELVTHNSQFWRAYYEIAPGDPAAMALHAGLLLAGGESARGLYVLVIAQQLPEVPAGMRQAFGLLAARAQQTLNKARVPLHEGMKLFDAGDYAGAAKKYRQQLALWPQDGWAAYELGLTLYFQQELAAGRKPPELGTLQINQGSPASPEVLAWYVRAREHDPFQYNAYQGSDPDTIRMALVMFKECRPAWEKLAKATGPVDRQVIERFSEVCQQAGVDELALVARQVVVARRGRYSPTDFPVINGALRGLAPGPAIEGIIKRLPERKSSEFMQLIAPERSGP